MIMNAEKDVSIDKVVVKVLVRVEPNLGLKLVKLKVNIHLYMNQCYTTVFH